MVHSSLPFSQKNSVIPKKEVKEAQYIQFLQEKAERLNDCRNRKISNSKEFLNLPEEKPAEARQIWMRNKVNTLNNEKKQAMEQFSHTC